MEERTIRVNIAGLELPVIVNKQDEKEEEVIRKASKLINQRIQSYQIHFSNKEKFDILAMVSLELSKELIKTKERKEGALDQDTILRISKKLDELL